MPIRYKPGCKTCALCRGNPKLRKRLHDAYYDREAYGESVRQIAEDIAVTDGAIYNHMKRHTTVAPLKAPMLVENAVQKLKAQIAKSSELAVDHDNILPQKDYEEALTTVIAEGLSELKKGDKKISVSQLIAAAKIKGDFDTKKRGQDAELLKMMMRSASGIPERPDDNPGTPGLTGQLAEVG